LAEGPDKGRRMATMVPPAGATCGKPGAEGGSGRGGTGLAGAGAGFAAATTGGGGAGGGEEQAATSISRARQADRYGRRTADSLLRLKL
jgi:hypothetical protein